MTGFVEDVRPYLHSATACVVPLRIARGVQNKLLEAMACGKAVIVTPAAFAGLRANNGEDLLVANSPNEFAAAVMQVIRDGTLRESLGWHARSFVEAHHDWRPLLQKLAELVESVAERKTESENPKVRSITRR